MSPSRRREPALVDLSFTLDDCKPGSSFDKCVDFRVAAYAFKELFLKAKELYKQYRLKSLKKKLGYLAAALIALLNGLRGRETIEAIEYFYETGERVLKLRARKRGDVRMVLIPEYIDREDVEHVYKLLRRRGEKGTRKRIGFFLWRNFGITLHSLRYSLVRYLHSNNVDHSVIAAMLGHKDIRTIQRYYLRGVEVD